MTTNKFEKSWMFCRYCHRKKHQGRLHFELVGPLDLIAHIVKHLPLNCSCGKKLTDRLYWIEGGFPHARSLNLLLKTRPESMQNFVEFGSPFGIEDPDSPVDPAGPAEPGSLAAEILKEYDTPDREFPDPDRFPEKVDYVKDPDPDPYPDHDHEERVLRSLKPDKPDKPEEDDIDFDLSESLLRRG